MAYPGTVAALSTAGPAAARAAAGDSRSSSATTRPMARPRSVLLSCSEKPSSLCRRKPAASLAEDRREHLDAGRVLLRPHKMDDEAGVHRGFFALPHGRRDQGVGRDGHAHLAQLAPQRGRDSGGRIAGRIRGWK
jgi:hypothetical protein